MRPLTINLEPIAVGAIAAGTKGLPPSASSREINNQHTRLLVPETHPLDVSDRVALGCSHPCTTFDKWRLILMVDSAHNIVDVISTLLYRF